MFTSVASACDTFEFSQCNSSDNCSWCLSIGDDGKQSGRCLSNSIADKLPAEICGGNKSIDNHSTLRGQVEGGGLGGGNGEAAALGCLSKPDAVCEMGGECEICRISAIDFSFCLPVPMAAEIPYCYGSGSSAPESESSAPGFDEIESCTMYDSMNLCSQNKGSEEDSCLWCSGELDGFCVEASKVSDLEECKSVVASL